MKKVCLALAVLVISACGAATGTDGGPSDETTDSGMTPVDSGTPLDAGTVHDAGTPVDAGTVHDAGTTPTDAGTTPTDAGNTDVDAGTCTTDGGAPGSITKCSAFLTCAQACSDQCCQQGCLNATSPTVMTNANAFVNCIQTNCPAGSASNCDQSAATGACLSDLLACEGA